MKPISYARHRFPPDVIRQAVWLYFRFTLSFRDVEDLMAERGIEVSYVRWLRLSEQHSWLAKWRSAGVRLPRSAVAG
jgi:transposase-like protein